MVGPTPVHIIQAVRYSPTRLMNSHMTGFSQLDVKVSYQLVSQDHWQESLQPVVTKHPEERLEMSLEVV